MNKNYFRKSTIKCKVIKFYNKFRIFPNQHQEFKEQVRLYLKIKQDL